MIVRTTKTRKMTIATANKILATLAVAADTPENPKKPATSEITKNIRAHFNMTWSFGSIFPNARFAQRRFENFG